VVRKEIHIPDICITSQVGKGLFRRLVGGMTRRAVSRGSHDSGHDAKRSVQLYQQLPYRDAPKYLSNPCRAISSSRISDFQDWLPLSYSISYLKHLSGSQNLISEQLKEEIGFWRNQGLKSRDLATFAWGLRYVEWRVPMTRTPLPVYLLRAVC
jgi:hypothetical protein